MEVVFTLEEIRILMHRFKRLDADGNGHLDVDELLSLEGIGRNPLATRIFSIFDKDENGKISFDEFAAGIAIFSSKGNGMAKLKFVFDIYDIDKDGIINNGELFHALKLMIGGNLDETQLQQVVDKTMLVGDPSGQGGVTFEAFCRIIGKSSNRVAQSVSLHH